MGDGFTGLWLIVLGLIPFAWAGTHVIVKATVQAPTNTQLVTGLCIAGAALVAAGVVLWKRQERGEK